MKGWVSPWSCVRMPETLRAHRNDSAADQAMRRFLRIGDGTDPGAIFGATQAMGRSLVVSALRCILTYLVIPIVAPFIGFFGSLSAPISLVLCSLAAVLNVRSVRRFWMADHKYRWGYTVFGAVVLAFLAFSVVTDVLRIFT